MVMISCEGAMLKRGSMRFSDQSMNPKRSTISFGLLRLNLPHTLHRSVLSRAD